MSNRKDGTDFERELCEKLRNYGFWVYHCPQSADGQPADIIAARDCETYLIDAKVCKSDTFTLSRVEENQRLAMRYFYDCGNRVGWFALRTSEDIYMIPLDYLESLIHNGETKLSFELIQHFGRRLGSWVKYIA